MLFFLLSDSVSFPLLGYLLNGVYYAAVIAALLTGFAGVYRKLVDLDRDPARVRRFLGLAALLALPAGLAGSRAANMFYLPPHQWGLTLFVEELVSGPHQTFHGAVAGAVVMLVVLIRRCRLSFLPTADAIFLQVPLCHAIARVGCLLAGCCWGRTTTLTCMGGAWQFRHPAPLYAIAANLLLFALLNRRFRAVYAESSNPPGAGAVAGLYLAGYGSIRFCLEMIRTETVVGAGLTQAQWVMTGFIAAGLIMLAAVYHRTRRSGHDLAGSA